MSVKIEASGDNLQKEITTSETVLPEEANHKTDKNKWEEREKELLIKISEYEMQKIEHQQKILQLENEVELKNQEKENNNDKILELEGELAEARKNMVATQEVHNLKLQSEELLTRAKGIIFEKTKMCKNQELQIEALTQQVTSLKEVVGITKDLLDIRNMEVKHLQEKLETMEERINNEKERHQMMHAKLEKMIEMNSELKREYETQLCLFSALRERYNERELARNIVTQLNGDANKAITTEEIHVNNDEENEAGTSKENPQK